jgi:hypothetical protein
VGAHHQELADQPIAVDAQEVAPVDLSTANPGLENERVVRAAGIADLPFVPKVLEASAGTTQDRRDEIATLICPNATGLRNTTSSSSGAGMASRSSASMVARNCCICFLPWSSC